MPSSSAIGKPTAAALPTLFKYFHTPKYATSGLLTLQRLQGSPLQFKSAALLARRPREGVWWHVRRQAQPHTFARKVVENAARRKLRRAFETALEKEGLTTQGVWRGEEGRGKDLVLHGTLNLVPLKETLTAEWDELVDQGRAVIQRIARTSARAVDGQQRQQQSRLERRRGDVLPGRRDAAKSARLNTGQRQRGAGNQKE